MAHNRGIFHAVHKFGQSPLCKSRTAVMVCEITAFRDGRDQCKRCAVKLAALDARAEAKADGRKIAGVGLNLRLLTGLDAAPVNSGISDWYNNLATGLVDGIIGWIEGSIEPGQPVAVIDDVATTGGSTIKAIERAQAEGLQVVKAVILVDRQEGGLDNIRKLVSDVESIVTRDELMLRWRELND